MDSIIYADKSLLPQARALWDTAFGEDKAFNDYFFENIFDIKNLLLYMHGGKMLAMTQTIPYYIAGIGTLTYIYGAATLPEYRGKGIMTRLLEKSFDMDRQNGREGSMLIPAEKSLFGFYEKVGYKTAFFIKNTVYKRQKTVLKAAEEKDWAYLNKIYETALSDMPHPVRSRGYWISQIRMFDALGGYVYLGEDAYAFGWGGEKPYIQELMGIGKADIAGGIAYCLGQEEIKAAECGGDVPLGMLKLYGEKIYPDMYFDLMFN